MGSELAIVLYAPAVAWAGLGVSLLLASRHAAPRLVLRLSATFAALWSLLATAGLAFVLSRGGSAAIVSLVEAPSGLLGLFQLQELTLWVDAAIAVLVLFAGVFLLNQVVGRGVLRLGGTSSLPWPAGLPRPAGKVSLLAASGARPEAFSFTLLELGRPHRRPHRHEVIVLTEPLLERLTGEEVEAVIAHELGHVDDLDSRYLTFLRTFAGLVRWDPIVGLLADRLTRHEEFRADDYAVARTGRPLALARAIYKVSQVSLRPPALGSIGLLGARRWRAHREALERIRRLVAMAESLALREASGG